MNKLSSVSYIGDQKRLREGTQGHNAKPYNLKHAEISSISSAITRDMLTLLQSMFDGIDDSFFELANNARNNNEQNRFFEAMRDIRIKRKNIENSFKQHIENQFSTDFILSPSSKQQLQVEAPNFESLSLIRNDDLEEEVAITSMVSKANSNFSGPLLQLHTRICNLYGISDITDCDLPINIRALTEHFAQACDLLEIELKEKLIVYKQFDRYVLSKLGPILDEANKTLIRLGIIPVIKHSKLPNSGTSNQAPTLVSQNTPSESPAERGTTQAPSSLPQLQNLLANIRDNFGAQEIGPRHNPNLPTQFISTTDLITLLSEIQNSSSELHISTEPKVVNIHNELKKQLNKESSEPTTQPQFKQVDDDLINLVSMLFEFILKDYNLAPLIQVLISRLQIPILKAVINDNSFFSSHQHPARKLLNALAKAGIGWNESLGIDDSTYLAMSQAVQTIINDYSGNLRLFEQVYAEFNAFIEKQDKKAKIVEQRTKESEIGQIKSRQAQKSVEDKLDLLFENSAIDIPELILDTIRGGWSRVMFLSFLRDEDEHQWERVCKTADNLIWCLQPFEKPKDRQYWIAIAPKVLKELKAGLESISYNASYLDDTIAEIRTILTNTFKQNSFNLSRNIEIPRQPLATPAANTAIERQKQSEETNLKEQLDLVRQLEPGAWIEFINNGFRQRCKLSTVMNSEAAYIFINRNGLKACEKSTQDLAEDLKKGNAVILEQSPLIDRALSALTEKLSQKASAL